MSERSRSRYYHEYESFIQRTRRNIFRKKKKINISTENKIILTIIWYDTLCDIPDGITHTNTENVSGF